MEKYAKRVTADLFASIGVPKKALRGLGACIYVSDVEVMPFLS